MVLALMGDEEVIVDGLVKVFDGVEAVRGVSFRVSRGEIFGLIGPNGAGKTTTLRMIVGLLKPNRGSVRVFGLDPWRDGVRFRRIISYLPEDAGVYKHMSGRYFLKFNASLYSDDPRVVDEMVEYGAILSGLGKDLDRPMGKYSKGMKRRILLARTFMVKPRLAVLDEPTSGLDVNYSVAVRRMIKEYVEENNATVILSSHNMLEVEYLCDRVAFINRGVIVAEGTPEELKRRYKADNLEEAFIEAIGGVY